MRMHIFVLFLSCSSLTFAENSKKPLTTAEVKASIAHPSLNKGTQIEIYRYDKSSDAFEVSIVKEPGVGPNVATPEALYKVIQTDVDFATFLKKKSEYVGAEFTLKEKLPLLNAAALAQRKKSLLK